MGDAVDMFILLDRPCCLMPSPPQVFNSVNLGQIFMTAVIASAIWWQSNNVADISGSMFFVSLQQSFNGLNTSMRIFPPERGLMIRERSNGSYRVGPYFLAKSTSDIGIYTVAPMLLAAAVYWCVGLRPEAGAFFIFLVLFVAQVRGERRASKWEIDCFLLGAPRRLGACPAATSTVRPSVYASRLGEGKAG